MWQSWPVVRCTTTTTIAPLGWLTWSGESTNSACVCSRRGFDRADLGAIFLIFLIGFLRGHVDVGQNGRPRGPQMLVQFSINHPIIEVPNFDPHPCWNQWRMKWGWEFPGFHARCDWQQHLEDLGRRCGALRSPSRNSKWERHLSPCGYGSIPIKIPFLVGWTSINPSYFDVNYRGTRFWHTAMC